MFFISIQLEIQTRLRAKNRVIEFCIFQYYFFLLLNFTFRSILLREKCWFRQVLLFLVEVSTQRKFTVCFPFCIVIKILPLHWQGFLTAAASFKNSYRTLKASRLGWSKYLLFVKLEYCSYIGAIRINFARRSPRSFYDYSFKTENWTWHRVPICSHFP